MKKTTITIGSTFDTVDGQATVKAYNGHIVDVEIEKVGFPDILEGELLETGEVVRVIPLDENLNPAMSGWRFMDVDNDMRTFGNDEIENLDETGDIYAKEVITKEELRLTLSEVGQMMKEADRHGENYKVTFEESVPRSVAIRDLSGLSRAAFSRRYNIPIRTLEAWDAEVRTAPEWTMDLLERAVREDFALRIDGVVYSCWLDEDKEEMTLDDVCRFFHIDTKKEIIIDPEDVRDAIVRNNDGVLTGHVLRYKAPDGEFQRIDL